MSQTPQYLNQVLKLALSTGIPSPSNHDLTWDEQDEELNDELVEGFHGGLSLLGEGQDPDRPYPTVNQLAQLHEVTLQKWLVVNHLLFLFWGGTKEQGQV